MKARGTSGAASVEFALVGLVFVSLLLLAMETGWQLLIESALGAGARAAARFGSTGTVVPPLDREGSIENIVIQNSGGLLLAGRLQVLEASYASFTVITGGGASTPGPGNASQIVQYTFTYTQPYLTPMAVAITGQQQMIHTVHVTVLNEPFPAS